MTAHSGYKRSKRTERGHYLFERSDMDDMHHARRWRKGSHAT